MKKSVLIGQQKNLVEEVYGGGRKEKLRTKVDCFQEIYTKEELLNDTGLCQELQLMFSTWGFPNFSEEELESLPKLEAVFYAAGSVKHFADPFLKKGVKVISGWAANAIPVAEFSVAQIFLASKGYWKGLAACASHSTRQTHDNDLYPGMFEIDIALLGGGMIGREVMQRLKAYSVNILLMDPYFPKEVATDMGITLVSMEEAFKKAQVISNHLPNIPETQQIVKESHFKSMRTHATFINTGRGQTIDEDALIRVLKKREDLTALLDVTYPEPPNPESPLYTLKNVHLSPHLAGAIGQERWRIPDIIMEELCSLLDGKAMRYSVSLEQLKNMA
jgi:phosphoglycerate dehydrogenase-like enzyme